MIILSKYVDAVGNSLETVSADAVDGVWVVSTETPDGTVTRAATTEEAVEFENTVNPPAPVLSASQQFAAVTGAALASGVTPEEKLAAIEQVLAAIAAGS